jgi:hypothetical protein
MQAPSLERIPDYLIIDPITVKVVRDRLASVGDVISLDTFKLEISS